MWAEMVQRYPCQWMMLAETEDDDDGNLAFAHVLDHDQSAIKLLDRTGLVPGATLIHTAGRHTSVSASFS